MLAKAAIGLDTVDHYTRLDHDFCMYAPIRFCDQSDVGRQKCNIYSDLRHIQNVSAGQVTFGTLIECII